MITVTGTTELKVKLDKLANKTLKQAIRKTAKENCKVVQEEAKNTTPQDTGLLARSIKVRTIPRSRVYVGSRVTIRIAGETKTNMGYGAFQEYGFTTKNGRKIEGKHFLKNAALTVSKQVLSNMTNDIQKAIKEIN